MTVAELVALAKQLQAVGDCLDVGGLIEIATNTHDLARAVIDLLGEAQPKTLMRTDELTQTLAAAPGLATLDDPQDPYPAELVGQLARSVLALDSELDDMSRYVFERHAEYKQRRNEQFEGYEKQRYATIAYLLDRADQYSNSSSTRAAFDELIEDIAQWRHVSNMRHGEYDDLMPRVRRICEKRKAADEAEPGR